MKNLKNLEHKLLVFIPVFISLIVLVSILFLIFNRIFAAGTINVEFNDEGDTLVINAYEASGDALLVSLEYKVDDGEWLELSDENDVSFQEICIEDEFGEPICQEYYSTNSFTENINRSDLEIGPHTVYVRVLDIEDTYLPSEEGESFEYSGPNVTLEAFNNPNDNNVYISGQSNTGDITFQSLQYSIDGNDWIEINSDDVMSGYGGTEIEAYFNGDNLPPGNYTLYLKVIGSDSNEWPIGGPVEVADFSGLDDSLNFNIQEDSNAGIINVDVSNSSGYLYIQRIEYRLNGGNWIQMPCNGCGDETGFASTKIPAIDITPGSQFVEIKAIDTQLGFEWSESFYTTIGSGSLTIDLFSEEFEEAVNTTFTDQLTSETMSSTIGSEWSIDSQVYQFLGSFNGRGRIHGDGYQQSGEGAFTFDSVGISPSGYILTLSQNLSSINEVYGYSTNLFLEFDVKLHGNNVNPSCSNLNKVYISDYEYYNFIEIYDVNSSAQGEYVNVSVDIDELFPGNVLNNTMQVSFDSCFTGSTDDQGYSIDNVKFVHKPSNSQVDNTPPVISYVEESNFTIAESQKIDLIATDDLSIISSVTAMVYINDLFVSTINAIPLDNTFNSLEEYVPILLSDVFNSVDQGSTYEIIITVENQSGLQSEETINGIFDTVAPEITFVETPASLLTNSFNISGTAIDAHSNILSVDVLVNGTRSFPADNSEFDSSNEAFTITLENLNDSIESGPYTIVVSVRDANRTLREYEFTGTIDTGLPTLESMPNLGQEPMDNSTPIFSGSVCDDVAIQNVQYRVFAGFEEIAWTNANPTDGLFNESCENFNFQTPALIDGVKEISIRITDVAGNVREVNDVDRIVINAIDSSAPIIDIQPITPNPTFDNNPNIQGKVGDDINDKTSNISLIWYSLNGGINWIEILPVDGVYDEVVEEFNIDLGELSLGDYDVIVRAIDASNNDTELQLSNKIESFTIIEQNVNVESTKIQKTADFVSHIDHDRIASENIIWGRGRVRLEENISIVNQTSLTTNQFGPRYGFTLENTGNFLYESQCNGGGVWTSKYQDRFSFYHRASDTEYNFRMSDYGITAGTISMEIAEIVVPSSGECHVWVTGTNGGDDHWILGINFGTSVIDGMNDVHSASQLTLDTGIGKYIKFLKIDTRNPENYGIWYTYGGGLNYLVPGNLSTTLDDQTGVYDTNGSYSLEDITGIEFRQYNGRDELWILDYARGIVVIDDNGTPLNSADDSAFQYLDGDAGMNLDQSTTNFGIVFNKNNEAVIGGNAGVFIIRDNGTFNKSDDSIVVLATAAELFQDAVAGIYYNPGTSMLDNLGNPVVGEQYYLTSRSGFMSILSTNDTPEDKLDDQIHFIDMSTGIYPTEVSDVIINDFDNLTIHLQRVGVFDVELNREFAASGSAITKVNSSLEGDYLDIDFATLEAVEIIGNPNLVSYLVSNDGGFTWVPIQIGQTVNFETNGYQLTFRMDLERGSTPIIINFLINYSAYRDETSRQLILDVDDEPTEVYTNELFDFTLKAIDELSNPFEDDQNVQLELREVSTNNVVSSFNITNATIANGVSNISNAQAAVLGLHYIYATNGSEFANSEVINFIGLPIDPPTASPTPTVSPTSIGNPCTLNPNIQGCSSIIFEITQHNSTVNNENNSTEICWTTNIAAKGYIRYGKADNIGNVEFTNTTEVTPDYLLSQCRSITNLEDNATYGYEITANTADGKTDSVIDRFVLNGIIPVDGEETQCISNNSNIISVNDENQATINFTTINSASCKVFYGYNNDLKYVYEEKEQSKIHSAVLDLNNFDGEKDVEYRIECNVSSENSATRLCNSSGFIPADKIQTGETKGTSIIDRILDAAQSVTQTAVPVSLTVATLGTSIINLFAYPRFLLYALGWIKDRKKYKPWGIVFDQNTKQPIPFVSVKIYSEGEFIKEIITNFDGKFGFPVDPGTYTISASHPEYNQFNSKINMSEEQLIAEDISLSSVDKSKGIKRTLRDNLRSLNTVIVLTGFIFSVIALIISPIPFNLLIVSLYIIQALILMLMRSPRNWGYVFNSMTREKLGGVFVRVFDPKESRQIDVQITDKHGRYGFLLPEGEYLISADANGFAFPSQSQNSSNLSTSKTGQRFIKLKVKEKKVINLAIPLDKKKSKKEKLKDEVTKKNQLSSPFGE